MPRRFFIVVWLGLAFCLWQPVVFADTPFIYLGKDQVHPTHVLAKLSKGITRQDALAKADGLGLSIGRQFSSRPGWMILDEPAFQLSKAKPIWNAQNQAAKLLERIADLRQSGLFERVEPDYVQHALAIPNDGRFSDGTLWGLRNQGQDGGTKGADVDAVRAWDITTGTTNLIVAVVDTGIRYTHMDLRSQMWHNPTETPGNRLDDDNDGYADNIYGINTVDRTGDPMDDNDHGSHVAGTIGAAANNGYGHVGVAWNVRLMACKFLDSDGYGYTSDAVECIDFAVSKGAKIINASWGGGPFSSSLFDSISNARDHGVLFVVAAGNEENDNDAYSEYPASFALDNVIAVAALDRRDQLAFFSNYGRNSVHLGAPGVEIYSTTAETDTSYNIFQGTSMAAPHVTGVAALILSKYPDASLSEVRNRLLSTTVPVSALRDKTKTGGRVNAYQALTVQPDGVVEYSVLPSPGSDLRAGSMNTIRIIVTDIVGITNATVLGHVEETDSDLLFKHQGGDSGSSANDPTYAATLNVPTNTTSLTIQLTITAPSKTTLTNSIVYSVVTPPINDNFANAIAIPAGGGTVYATNKLATIEPSEPLHAQDPNVAASVWWNWTPQASSDVIIDTAGSLFDTVLGVYTNKTLAGLKEVASVDDSDKKLQGYVRFHANPGTTYRIAVAGYSESQTGAIRLRVQPGGDPDTTPPVINVTSPMSGLTITNINGNKVTITGTASDPSPNATDVAEVLVQLNGGLAISARGATNWSSPQVLDLGYNTIKIVAVDNSGNRSASKTVGLYYRPLLSPNDLFNNAIELLGREGMVRADSAAATKEFGEPLHGGNAGGKSVWWFYRPTADGVLTLSTEGSSFNTVMGLYTGTRVTNLTTVASNDDISTVLKYSQIKQAVRALQTYSIAVDGFGGQSGTVNLSYSFTPETIYRLTVSSAPGGAVTPASGDYSGNTTVVITAVPDANYFFDHWEGDISSTGNPLTVQLQKDLNLIAQFRGVTYADDFETGDLKKLSWSNSGNLPWIVQTNEVASGHFAARSGAIAGGQKSSLILTIACQAGSGAFDYNVGSEKIWDSLEFFLSNNGARQRLGAWSGTTGWQHFQFVVPAGTNTFEWRYSKDLQNDVAPDAAFIDNLELPLKSAEAPPTPATLVIQHDEDGSLQIRISGQPGRANILQVSPDLKGWQSISTNMLLNGSIRVADPGASVNPLRFYRTISP